jgi:hypothetical protein
MGLRGVTAIALLWFPVACGGRVLEEQTPGEPTTSEKSSSAPDAATPKPSGGASADNFDGTVSLPPCVKGKLETELDQSTLAQTCPYLYAGRCYTTKVKACACACPNRSGTVCSSGFPSLEGTTVVSCG